MPDDVAKRVTTKIREAIQDDGVEIGTESRLQDDLGLKSMDTVAIAFDIEKEFGIEVNADDLVEIRTVGDVIALVRHHLATAT